MKIQGLKHIHLFTLLLIICLWQVSISNARDTQYKVSQSLVLFSNAISLGGLSVVATDSLSTTIPIQITDNGLLGFSTANLVVPVHGRSSREWHVIPERTHLVNFSISLEEATGLDMIPELALADYRLLYRADQQSDFMVLGAGKSLQNKRISFGSLPCKDGYYAIGLRLSGAIDAHHSEFVATSKSLVANGQSTTSISLLLIDPSGNPINVGGDDVKFFTTKGHISTYIDHNNGLYSATLTSSTKSGIATLSFSVNDTISSQTIEVNFIPGELSLQQSYLSASKPKIVADGSSFSTISVFLLDEFGNRIFNGNYKLDIYSTKGKLSVIKLNRDGTHTSLLTSDLQSGVSILSLYINDDEADQKTEVEFIAGPYHLSKTIIQTSKNTLIANGADQAVLTVQLRDINNNLITTGGVQVQIISSNGSVGNTHDNGDGTYSATIVSPTSVGSAVVKATVGLETITGSVSINFVSGSTDLSKSIITVSPTTLLANGRSSSDIQIVLMDAYNNRVSLISSDLTLYATAGTLSSLVAMGNGVYKTKLTSTSVAETATITYAVSGSLAPQSTTIAFVTGTPVASMSSISVDNDTIIADGLSTVNISLRLSDMYGNRLVTGGESVNIFASLGTVTDIRDMMDGTYSAVLRSSTRSGISTVSFSVNGSMVSSQTARVQLLPGTVSPNHCRVTVSPTTLIADGVSQSKITISLFDKNGNALSKDDATIIASANRGVVGGVSKQANGTYRAIFTSDTLSQSANISFSVNAEMSSNNATISLLPGLPVANNSSLSLAQDTIAADGKTAATVTVVLRDAFGNRVVSGNDRVVITTSIGEVVSVIDIGDGTYKATIISNGDIGVSTIRFSVNESTLATDKLQLVIVPRAIDVEKSLITAADASITADGISQTVVSVQLRDDEGGNLARDGEVVEIFTDKGVVSRVVNIGGGLYQALLTSTTMAEKATLYFSVNKVFNATKVAVVTFLSGFANVNTSSIVVSENRLRINSAQSSMITVQLKDKFGNIIDKGGEQVQISATIGEIGTVADNGNGSYSALYSTTLVSGVATIRFSINGGQNSINSTRITVLSGSAVVENTTISAQPDLIEADGISQSVVTVLLKDIYGNRLLEGGSVVTMETSAGTLSAVEDKNNGSYTAVLTSTDSEIIATVTCRIDGVLASDSVKVTFKFGVPLPSLSTITAWPTVIEANGISTSQITVQTVDSLGVNLTQGGKAIKLSTTAGKLSAVTDHLDGTYTATLTSDTTIQSVNISFLEEGVKPENGVTTVLFVAGKSDISQAHLSVSDSVAIADGQTSVLLTISLEDRYGNLLNHGNDTVQFFTTSGTLAAINDNQNGTYTTLLTSPTHLDTANISFSVNGLMSSETAHVAFVVGRPSAAASLLTVSLDTITADGTSSAEIWLFLRDAVGNPIITGGDNITFITSKGDVGSVVDHGDGTYSTKLTSGFRSGICAVRFSVNSTLFSQQKATIVFTPGEPDLITSTISASPTDMIANGRNSSLITVALLDKYGNQALASGDVISMASTAGALSNVTTNFDGTYSAKLTCTTKIDTAHISFYINGNLASNNEDIYFVEGLAVANNSLISATPDSLTIDGVSTAYVEVYLKDANENRVSESSDDVVITANGVALTNVINNGDGTFGVTLPTPQRSGFVNFGFTLNSSTPSDNTAKVTIVAGGIDVDKSTINATQTTLIADGISTTKLYVQLNDMFGNRVTSIGDHVQFITNNGTFSDVVYEGGGLYSSVLTSSVEAGQALIQFNANGSNVSKNSLVIKFLSGTQVPDSAAISATPNPIVADGESKTTVTLQLRDVNNNPYLTGGHLVAFKTDIGTLGVVSDHHDGSYSVDLTSNVIPDTATVQFSVNGSTLSAIVAEVVFVAGPAVADSSAVTVFPTIITADGESRSTITIQLFDKLGHMIMVGGAQVLVTSDNGTINTITDHNDGSYTAFLTSSKVHQKAAITITVDSVTMSQLFFVDFMPGSAASIFSNISASPDSLVANGLTKSTVEVVLADAFGNSLISGGDTVVIKADNGEVGEVTDLGDGHYTAEYTSDTISGIATLTFNVNSLLSVNSETVTLVAGDAVVSQSTISVSADSLVANGTDECEVMVQLKDNFGNILIKGGDQVQIFTNRGTLYEVTDHHNGSYSARLKASTNADTAIITFTVNSLAANATAMVQFVAGAADIENSQLTVYNDTIVADGVALTEIRVQLLDTFGNSLTTGGDVVDLLSDFGTISAIIDNKNGTYNARLTSSRIAQVATISFSVNQQYSEVRLRVVFIPGDVDPNISILTVLPEGIVADGTTTAAVEVLLKDQYGNQLISTINSVQIFTTYGILSMVNTSGNGRYLSTIKSDYYGAALLSFSVNGIISDNTFSYYFSADDKDNDGLLDDEEDNIGTDPYDVDTDKDGVTDFTEVADGTDPLLECDLLLQSQTVAENISSWNLLDCDADGIFNGFETPNADGDDLPDYLDADDDNDGLPTADEMPDPNGDGDPKDAYDADRDGLPDYLDANSFSSSADDDLEIYNAISPNGDGLNDLFTIRNIEKYPTNRLTIVNRWGAVVYDEANFAIRNKYFDGKETGRDELLPVGVYFYVLKYTNDSGVEKSRDGYLYLNY